MGLTLFDLSCGVVLVFSAMVGFARGATREITTLVAFVLAALVAVFGLRFTSSLARHFIATPWLANIAAILVVFVIVYMILRMIGARVTLGVRRTVLSSFDRALGFAIGLVRGLAVIGAFTLLINAATPPERMPAWIVGARLYPLADRAGGVLRAFAPQGFRLAHDVATGAAQAVTAGGGESAAQRRSMDVVVEKSR